MNDAITLDARVAPDNLARAALIKSAQLWFVVAMIGQWIFVAYIALHYSGLALQGTANSLKAFGIHAGDNVGNLAMVLHVAFAAVIIGGGPLQLIPAVRAKAPRFHHWNGRIYMIASLLTAVGGFYLVWTRDIPGGLVMRLGVSLDAILIIAFALLAIRYAMAGDFRRHRRWALRLFMVVSAVWFFRIGLMGWLTINQGPVGIDFETFTGPFLNFLNFAQYLLPLAILEFYLRAREGSSPSAQWAVAATIAIATLLTAVGIFAATAGMWLPELAADSSYWRS